MLNYIWTGLIAFSLLFALAGDFQDLRENRYRNDAPLPVRIETDRAYRPDARRQSVQIRIDSSTYRSFFDVETRPDTSYAGTLIQTEEGREITFGAGTDLPEPLATIHGFLTQDESDPLRGVLTRFESAGPGAFEAAVQFRRVRFVKLNAIAQAAFDFAETAVSIAIGLIGILALWLGLLRIAEEAGLIRQIVRIIQPILRPLFPDIPRGHPAMAMVSLNLGANVLGLSNAATPLGLKAMEELQELNPSEDTATNSMVMLLALNTSSVQLVPPSLLVAIMGMQINRLIFAIILATTISTVVGAVAALLLQNMPGYRMSDPHRTAGLREGDGPAASGSGDGPDAVDPTDLLDADDESAGERGDRDSPSRNDD